LNNSKIAGAGLDVLSVEPIGNLSAYKNGNPVNVVNL
jgi:hypothetical protein